MENIRKRKMVWFGHFYQETASQDTSLPHGRKESKDGGEDRKDLDGEHDQRTYKHGEQPSTRPDTERNEGILSNLHLNKLKEERERKKRFL